MESNIKWWFAPANHGDIKGENTGDKELFKKDTYVSLAREILQNSIDARNSDEEPVFIDFKEFKIKIDDIPGIDDYKKQIKRCVSYWKTNDEFKQKYQSILEYLDSNKEIECLRISDRNTTGLVGIESIDSTADNSYNALVKGTGVSKKKTDYAGGSKGVGKNVPFLLSKLMMVFYVTNTIDDKHGYVGVAKLASGYIDDNENDSSRDYTQGTGYFASTDLILPINEYISFDKSYNDRPTNYGTDIYIIGFEGIDNWIKDVINSTLESFMATIVRNDLCVSFNDIEINQNTLGDIVYSDYIDNKYKKSIVAQYKILTNKDDSVKAYDIETELGNAKMYILPYKKNEENEATKKCAMIRTPMMLIKNYDLAFNVSAMVIIEQNTLGKVLRSIENPQHKDWEPKRIKDIPERREVEAAIASMREQINQNVIDCLKLGDDLPLDPNGAGEFLAAEEDGDEKGKENKSLDQKDTAEVGVVKKINYSDRNPSIKDFDGYGDQPDIGEMVEDEDGDDDMPSGENNADGGEPRGGDEPGRKEDGGKEVIIRANIVGVKYKVISTNKAAGEFKIVFVSPEYHDKCYLNVSLLDDANNAKQLEILKLTANGKEIDIDNKYEPGTFEVRKNEKNLLLVKVDKNDYFACEVKVKYENRI